tara:strand:+ start:519 stop:2708 length:2190 start_codon:yes stop_codon:yes gene_type:complete
MIDNNKLLSRDRMATGRNVVTIKRNLIKIDSLLKERLVLVKVRQGILRQQEQNRMRRQREEDLEGLQSTNVQGDSPEKQGSNFISGIIKSILGLSGIFLPQLLRLLNFLRRIVEPVKKMATAVFGALSTFFKVGVQAVDKISDAFNFKGSTLKGLDAATITAKFGRFEFALNTFVNALLFAGAMQTLSSVGGDVESVMELFKKSKVGSKGKSTIKSIMDSDSFKTKADKLLKGKTTFDPTKYPVKPFTMPLRKTPIFIKSKPKVSTIPKVDTELLKNIFKLEQSVPVDEVYKFLNQNKLKSPAEIYRLATTSFESDLLSLASKVDSKQITEIMYNRAVRESVFVYESALSELSKYSTDLDEIFNLVYEGKTLPQSLKFPLEDFLMKQKNLKKLIADFDDALPLSKKVLSDTLKETTNKATILISENLTNTGDRNVGAAARSFFPNTMPDLIYPSLFERGRSALFEAGEFFKGVDKTMVDFATKQTDKIASVITSGPLRGFTQGAKGMFRKAVGETIGLVPFLGDLIGLLLDIYLFGEIPERAGYKAVGGILGGFVGALIGSIPPLVPFGGPIIGSIIGGIGGDILGGIVYDMVKGKDTKVKTSDVGSSSVKNAVKEGLITFGNGGFTGKGDSRKVAGAVHYREFVIDPDSTLAVRQNAPGFLEDLNSAKGFESLEVLRNFASYEGTQTVMAQFIPIPIPINTQQTPSSINIVSEEETNNSIYSYHYARG